MEEGRGPRVPRSKGSKVQGSQGPKDQDISNSHSNTSLTLKKVHLVVVTYKLFNCGKDLTLLWTPFTHKKIFLHFWAKNNLLLYTWRATCPFDPQKMLFRGFFFKVSLKRPPRQYPDISEPGQGRVKQVEKLCF